MLRAVDIASHQAGISIADLDCDIVIIKATGGTSYVNGRPYEDEDWWRIWADEALAAGKKLAFYHYAAEYGILNDARAEAEWFLSHVRDYKGKFVPILDFEAEAQQLPVSWPEEWLEIVEAETGATPMFYGYANHLNSRDYSEIARFPLWMASYLYRYYYAGWVDDPQNIWPTSSWDSMAMYQYTSAGQIAGYGGNLDLSVFYGNEEDWKRMEGGKMGSAQGLIDVAYSYLGMTEDDPRFVEMIDYYNAQTDGYDMLYWDEWCACFVSVCSIKSGNRDATGTNVNCAEFRRIWREKGIYREPWEVPAPGWLIDYDWEQDGIPDHIGIVADCDGKTIHVIEGNTDGEMCAEHWIPVGNQSISCFAAPNYEEDDMAADQVWNYGLQGPNANMSAGERLVDIQRQFYRTDDASGRGMEVPFIERLAWMAAKQGKQNDLLVAIAEKVGIDPKEAREMLDVDPSSSVETSVNDR